MNRKYVLYDSQKMMRDFRHHVNEWSNCNGCPSNLGARCRNHVFARGKIPADVLWLGEAPGPDEDLIGYPFIGRAGRLLDKMISNVSEKVGTFRSAFTNILSCIPYADPDNRDGFRAPTAEEAAACSIRLQNTVKLINPTLIVLLGKVAENNFDPLQYVGYSISVYHPSYSLRKGGYESLEYKRTKIRLTNFLNKHLPIEARS